MQEAGRIPGAFLQIVAAIPTMLFFLFRASGDAKPALNELLASLSGLTSDMEYLQTLNLVYAILALLVFGTWYYKIFVKPFRHRRKKYPSGYSFHTITSMFFLGIGLQYVTTMLTDAIGVLRPDLITAYHAQMSSQGYDDLSLLLLVYSVILAPVIEETVFRGLVFRYARHAMPYWFANILQAALFGHLRLCDGTVPWLGMPTGTWHQILHSGSYCIQHHRLLLLRAHPDFPDAELSVVCRSWYHADYFRTVAVLYGFPDRRFLKSVPLHLRGPCE